MAPERIPSTTDIGAGELNVVEVKLPMLPLGYCDHLVRVACGNYRPVGKPVEVSKHENRRDGVPQQEVQHLVPGDRCGGQQPVAGHQEGGVARYLLLHHPDEHDEGEVACLLHLLRSGGNVAVDG